MTKSMLESTITGVNLLILVIVFIFGIVGNAIAFKIFVNTTKRNNRFERLLSYLAIVDLLSTIFMPGLLIYLTAVDWKQWHFGSFLCKLLRSLPSVFITLSQSIIILISYQRYRIVKKPLETPVSNHFIAIWLAFSTLVAIILVIPWTLTLEIIENPLSGLNTCTSTSQTSSKNGFILNFGFDIIMLVRDILSCLFILQYGKLTIQALKRHKEFYSRHQHLLQQTKKAKSLLNSITIVYLICILPIDIFHVAYFTSRALNVQINEKVYSYLKVTMIFLKTLQATQSSINPLIYSKKMKEFRVLSCLICGQWMKLKRMFFPSKVRRKSKEEFQNSEIQTTT